MFPNDLASGLPTHQAVLVAFDDGCGSPIAVMDATYIMAVRTAAASAVATDLLAPSNGRVLAILGTGVQARCHAQAVTRVRDFEEIVVAGRRPAAAEALAAELKAELGIPATTSTFDGATARADVVCTTTHSPDPLIRGAFLRRGVHVNSVGVNRAGREVDAEAVRRSRLFVDSRADHHERLGPNGTRPGFSS